MFGQRRDYFLRSTSEMACFYREYSISTFWGAKCFDERQRTALAIYDSLRVRPNMTEICIYDYRSQTFGRYSRSMERSYANRLF